MILARTPNLWELRRIIGNVKTKAIITYALIWIADLINVERNLTEVQIAELTADIIEEYGFLKVEELKYIFKHAVRSNQIYGRLDYNVVMNWLKNYCDNRTELCMDISDQEDREKNNKVEDPNRPGAISLSEYRQQLSERAAQGDEDAADILNSMDDYGLNSMSSPQKSGLENKQDFRKFRIKYILSKKLK